LILTKSYYNTTKLGTPEESWNFGTPLLLGILRSGRDGGVPGAHWSITMYLRVLPQKQKPAEMKFS